MKKSVLLMLVMAFTVGANAQLLVEDFNYAASSALIGQGGWAITGASVVNPFTVGSSGLTYTGYLGSGVGNSLPINTTGQDVNRGFTNQAAGSVYGSLLVNFSAVQLGGTGFTAYTGDYFFHFTQGLITSNAFYARVFARLADNGKIAFGVSKSSVAAGAIPVFSDSIYVQNTTYLLVVKYQFNPGTTTDDQVSLFVFADPTLPASEPGTPTVGPVTTAQTDATGLDLVCLRQGTASQAPTGIIDGIRVGTSWNDAPLPVELTSFSAMSHSGIVNISWSTATEKNNSGFSVERKSSEGKWNTLGFVKGHGTSNTQNSYSYSDAVTAGGKYVYRLKQMDNDGKFEYSKEVEAAVALLASDYTMGQNYPNPFNPTTNIRFAVKNTQHATLKVYNLIGQEVATLFEGTAVGGQMNTVPFDASRLTSGTYIYQLKSAERTEVKRMTLVK